MNIISDSSDSDSDLSTTINNLSNTVNSVKNKNKKRRLVIDDNSDTDDDIQQVVKKRKTTSSKSSNINNSNNNSEKIIDELRKENSQLKHKINQLVTACRQINNSNIYLANTDKKLRQVINNRSLIISSLINDYTCYIGDQRGRLENVKRTISKGENKKVELQNILNTVKNINQSANQSTNPIIQLNPHNIRNNFPGPSSSVPPLPTPPRPLPIPMSFQTPAPPPIPSASPIPPPPPPSSLPLSSVPQLFFP